MFIFVRCLHNAVVTPVIYARDIMQAAVVLIFVKLWEDYGMAKNDLVTHIPGVLGILY